jgi:hypothetical protein
MTSVIDTATPRLIEIIKKIDDFSQPLREVGEKIKEQAVANFDRQGFYFGGWSPLAMSTRKQRKALGYGAARPILIRTGKLMRGFKVTSVKKDSVTVANEVPYAVYHDSDRIRTRLPQRKVLMVDRKVLESARIIFRNYFRSIIA